MSLKPIKNTILFKFNDHVNTRGEFERQATSSGILLSAGHADSAQNPRWATVTGAGPDCRFVSVGQEVLIPALRWTPVIKHDGENYWKTDEKEVVATRNNGAADTVTAINDFVLFVDQKVAAVREVGMFTIVGNVTETPRGTIVSVGADCAEELEVGMTAYYDQANFFDTFDTGTGGGRQSFLKEEKIIVYSA